jgi:hypothetical protein
LDALFFVEIDGADGQGPLDEGDVKLRP